MKATIFFSFLFVCLVSGPASSLSPPPDIISQPFSSKNNPIVLTQGTPQLHLSLETQVELNDRTFDVSIRAGEVELGQAEAEFLKVSTHRGTLKIAVAELEVGTYELEVTPSFEAYDFDPIQHLKIVAEESSITVNQAELGTITREGGQQTCCDLAEEDDVCYFEDDCERCWNETRFMDRNLTYTFEFEGVQASVEALLNGESHQTREFYEYSQIGFQFPEEEAGPYCVELIVRGLDGAILQQTEEECFASEDFPELSEPEPIEPPQVECASDPIIVNPTGPTNPGNTPKASGDDSSSCSTAAGGPGVLMLLAIFGLLRRRRS